MKLVFAFGDNCAEGCAEDRSFLGGKGANLHEMTRQGIPVPPGFTVSAHACHYAAEHAGTLPPALGPQVDTALEQLGKRVGRGFGDPQAPLLVSVRSGAAASMPGMMDTILNVGLTDATLAGLIATTGDERFALDCYRRLIAMYANVVDHVDHAHFELALRGARQAAGVTADHELSPAMLRQLIEEYKRLYQAHVGLAFAQDAHVQLARAIDAVIQSWESPRSQAYRKLNTIEGLLGTAVNVQAMVFGNGGPDCATGVCFSRCPSTGANEPYGEVLFNAQGEDVVAGIRTPEPISALAERSPTCYEELLAAKDKLERHFGDMQDLEFTVEHGRLFLLQARAGKRSGVAALRIACDMAAAGEVSQDQALAQVRPEHVEQVLFPVFSDQAKQEALVLGRGLNASPGAAWGAIVLDSQGALDAQASGRSVILVREQTSPEDVRGMAAAAGVLTATGGRTSHAAVVARGMGKPCIAGCGELSIDIGKQQIRIGEHALQAGDPISIDGTSGQIFAGALATSRSEILQGMLDRARPSNPTSLYGQFVTVMGWADGSRRLRVRANADTPTDAAIAVALGAEGIGLCRTEHMFFGVDRLPKMQAMILADSDGERETALAELAQFQRDDFVGIFSAMGSRPVTIRLLDPPLHEFLPHGKREQRALAKKLGLDPNQVTAKIRALHEFNPMLGHRGCRLGITQPAVYAMQVRAIVEAALSVKAQGISVAPEIMVPLVGSTGELSILRKLIEEESERAFAAAGERVDIQIGTMIEVPRACLQAGEIAHFADFFSFGTNDLTQCTFGLSRDDAGRFLDWYVESGILRFDPFKSLDVDGVGQLIRTAVDRGRNTRKSLHLGICGEHGGDPASIRFCHEAGLDYVSCSPFRLPAARLAAAHAHLDELRGLS